MAVTVKVITKLERTIAELAYVPEVAKGLGLTMSRFFKTTFGKEENKEIATVRYPEEQREYLHTCKLSAEALMDIINDILDFSKIEAGRLDLETISFNLQDCVDQALRSFSLRADHQGVELAYHVQRAPCLAGRARPGGEHQSFGLQRPDLRNVDRRVPLHERSVAQTLEVPSQVVDEAVEVVDE